MMTNIRNKRRHGKQVSGSYTIEAALLMGIILPVLIALLITGFYVHDRAKLQGGACELAARGCCLVLEKNADAQLGKTAGILQKGTMWARNVHAGGSAGKDFADAYAQGDFPFPGFTAAFLGSGNRALSESWERRIYHPASLIRKVRGMEYLYKQISE